MAKKKKAEAEVAADGVLEIPGAEEAQAMIEPELAAAQARSYHAGWADACARYSHTFEGTQYIGQQGVTLAKAWEANDDSLRAKLAGLFGTVQE